MDLPIEDLKPIFIKLTKKSAWGALESYEYLLKAILPEDEINEEEKNRLMRVSMTCLSQTFSLISQFETLYSLDSDDRDEIDTYINLFYRYNQEYMECEKTNHSHSHTIEYFKNYCESLHSLAILLDIDLDYIIDRMSSHF